jgi:hypothetical protein
LAEDHDSGEEQGLLGQMVSVQEQALVARYAASGEQALPGQPLQEPG